MNRNAYIIAAILVGVLIVIGFAFFGTGKREETTIETGRVNIGVVRTTPSATPGINIKR